MSAKLVIQKYIEDYKTVGKSIIDLPFDNLPFLTAKEPVFNMKGERISKSYYDLKGKEAVKIVYKKLVETYEGIANVFVGVQKEIQFIDWSGNVGFTKKKQPYYFSLIPVTLGDDTNTIVNYSRKLGVEPEIALTKSINKFLERFQKMEQLIKKDKKQSTTN